jgi:methionine-rich copper-binding protein CopC
MKSTAAVRTKTSTSGRSSVRGRLRRASALGAVALAACNPVEASPGSSAGDQSAAQSILQRSTPADGARVAGPLQRVKLWFTPPVRLVELIVTGADGFMMPTMITPVEPAQHYRVPLSGLSQGAYTIRWRAVAEGRSHEGEFSFEVR